MSPHDLDIVLSEKLASRGVTVGYDTARRSLNDLFTDQSFVQALTTAIHDAIGSPFDKGDPFAKSCSDYAESIVNKLLWR